jgi:hypothetical protein
MTTPRAALHVASESEGSTSGRLSELSRDQDPLRRLEAELQSSDGGHSDAERLYEQAWGLLEEAWSLVTDCLVMRDGLLDACAEIERTMDAVHRRLGALAVSPELASLERTPLAPPARERSGVNEHEAVQGLDDALAP